VPGSIRRSPWLAGLLLPIAPAAFAATITVDTTAVTGSGNCTLPEAIEAANTNAAVDACTAGAGDDEVDLTGLAGTIDLAGGLLITSNVTIRGPGARELRISGSALSGGTQMIRNDSSATVEIEDLTVADKQGDGIFSSCLIPCQGHLILDRVRVTNCRSGPDMIFFGDGAGGAMSTNCTDADVTIRDSLFDANVSTGNTFGGATGGAIWWAGRDLTIVNTTFSGNSAVASGGAVWLSPYVAGGGETILRNVTFSGNAAAEGAAIAVIGGTNSAENTVFANSMGNSCALFGGTFTSAGHNLSDDASCSLAGSGDQNGLASRLDVLGDNGGPTDTHAPIVGSPLVDAGDPAGCSDENGAALLADQRGLPRPLGAACDVGAVEDAGSCPRAPLAACHTAQKAQLRLAGGADPARRQLRWSWKKGDEVAIGELGDPSTTTPHGFCIYDGVDGAPSLALQALVPPGAAWSGGAKGWKYRDKTGAASGVASIALKAGSAGKAGASLQARGANVPEVVPDDGSELFDQDPAVTVQLLGGAGACWTSEFLPDGTQRNDAAEFRAKGVLMP